MDDKYIVFKKSEWEREKYCTPVEDAVVIRRQDAFAPPALDAYANAIQCVIEVLCNGMKPSGKTEQLQGIADYFHDQAAKSWSEQRKLPD